MERPIEDVALDIENLTKKIRVEMDKATQASEAGDDEGLSTALMRLARLNLALGRLAAYAKYISRNADRAARRKRGELTLQYSQTQAVNKSELQAELAVKKDFQVASDAELLANEADDLTFRTDTFLKMAQSRLSLLKSDKRG